MFKGVSTYGHPTGLHASSVNVYISNCLQNCYHLGKPKTGGDTKFVHAAEGHWCCFQIRSQSSPQYIERQTCPRASVKHMFGCRIHSCFSNTSDTRYMWQGVNAISDYKTLPQRALCIRHWWLPSWYAERLPHFTKLSSVCLLPKLLQGGYHIICPSPGPYPHGHKDTYVRMLFIDLNSLTSAFSSTIPQQLILKWRLLGFYTSLCNWIWEFLTDSTSRNIMPQGYVLSQLLFTLLTHDFTTLYSSNKIIKFADDTTVVGLISRGDESAYRKEMEQLPVWCKSNNLLLKMNKMK